MEYRAFIWIFEDNFAYSFIFYEQFVESWLCTSRVKCWPSMYKIQTWFSTLGTRKRFGRKHLGVDVTFIRKRNGNIVENRDIWDSPKRISSFVVPHASVLFTVCCSKRKYKWNRWVTLHEKQEEVEGLKKDMRTASSRRDKMSSMLGGQRLRLAIETEWLSASMKQLRDVFSSSTWKHLICFLSMKKILIADLISLKNIIPS